jgi:hypothetical protein
MKVKNLFSIALVAVLCTTQINVKANTAIDFGGFHVNFSTTDKTLKVSVSNAITETVSISLEDTEGVNLVSETIEAKPNFIKSYRLDKLPEGKYQFTLKRNGVKVVQSFDLTSKGILGLSIENREEMLLPSLVQKDNKVFISSFIAKGDKTTVRVLNNDGTVVFEDTYTDEILRKTFDVSKLSGGVFFFEVLTKNEAEYLTIAR